MTSFWNTLERPIIGLSPMDGVGDHPFRYITKKYGNPAIMYTEFTSVEGVCHGAVQLLKDFLYDETQRPIIGQVYGTTPEFFRQTAILLCQLGFDGIDINMGCPAKNVAHSGAGAALIKTPQLAQEIFRATAQGVEDWLNGQTAKNCPNITAEITALVEKRQADLAATAQVRRKLPVSVKTRIGFDHSVVETWIPTLLELEPAEITLHGRTLKQQYGGLANWDEIAKAAQLAHQTKTLLLGNGDIKTLQEAYEKIKTYGTDGVLIGRATMGNPFIFNNGPESDQINRFAVALEHAQLFETTYAQNEKYNFLPMRKHLGWYVTGIPNAAELRQAIYRCNSSADFLDVLRHHHLDTDLVSP